MWLNDSSLDKEIKGFSESEKLTAVESVIKSRKEIAEKQNSCKHMNIKIYGTHLVGQATCEDCGKTDSLYIFLNGIFSELNSLYNKLSNKVKK